MMRSRAVSCLPLLFVMMTGACRRTAPDDTRCGRLRVFRPNDSLSKLAPSAREVDVAVQVGATGPTVRVNLNLDSASTVTGDADTRVGSLRIFSCTTGALVQSLEVTGRGGPEDFLRFFEVNDVNFDGYLDLGVLREFGAMWMRKTWWVFDPQSKRFVSNDLTSALGTITANGLELDSVRQNVVAGHLQAVCGPTRDIYHVEDHRRLVLMHQEEIDPEADGSCTVTIRDRIDGRIDVKRERRRELQ